LSSTLIRHGFQPEVAKLLLLNQDVNKIADFVIVYELYKWVLEDLELEKLEFKLAVEFLAKLKKKFRK